MYPFVPNPQIIPVTILLISDVVTGGIFGIGADGYILAIIAMQKMIKK